EAPTIRSGAICPARTLQAPACHAPNKPPPESTNARMRNCSVLHEIYTPLARPDPVGHRGGSVLEAGGPTGTPASSQLRESLARKHFESGLDQWQSGARGIRRGARGA